MGEKRQKYKEMAISMSSVFACCSIHFQRTVWGYGLGRVHSFAKCTSQLILQVVIRNFQKSIGNVRYASIHKALIVQWKILADGVFFTYLFMKNKIWLRQGNFIL